MLDCVGIQVDKDADYFARNCSGPEGTLDHITGEKVKIPLEHIITDEDYG